VRSILGQVSTALKLLYILSEHQFSKLGIGQGDDRAVFTPGLVS
jgi:hypothetical protein